MEPEEGPSANVSAGSTARSSRTASGPCAAETSPAVVMSELEVRETSLRASSPKSPFCKTDELRSPGWQANVPSRQVIFEAQSCMRGSGNLCTSISLLGLDKRTLPFISAHDRIELAEELKAGYGDDGRLGDITTGPRAGGIIGLFRLLTRVLDGQKQRAAVGGEGWSRK